MARVVVPALARGGIPERPRIKSGDAHAKCDVEGGSGGGMAVGLYFRGAGGNAIIIGIGRMGIFGGRNVPDGFNRCQRCFWSGAFIHIRWVQQQCCVQRCWFLHGVAGFQQCVDHKLQRSGVQCGVTHPGKRVGNPSGRPRPTGGVASEGEPVQWRSTCCAWIGRPRWTTKNSCPTPRCGRPRWRSGCAGRHG